MTFTGTVLANDHRDRNVCASRRPNPGSETSTYGRKVPEMAPPKMAKNTKNYIFFIFLYNILVFLAVLGGVVSGTFRP